LAIWSDTNQFSPSDVPLATDIDAIYASIENILSTSQGQRVFKPWLGAGIEKYLFELMDEQTAFAIEHEVIRAIEQWEPRVTLLPQLTSIVPDYENLIYNVKLVFQIVGRPDAQFEYHGLLEKPQLGQNVKI
jgi:phage baseplate assembly protein W